MEAPMASCWRSGCRRQFSGWAVKAAGSIRRMTNSGDAAAAGAGGFSLGAVLRARAVAAIKKQVCRAAATLLLWEGKHFVKIKLTKPEKHGNMETVNFRARGHQTRRFPQAGGQAERTCR